MKRGLSLETKKGQVLIETVIYTLIAFAILGAVLAFSKPKIEELQDRSIIERTLQMFKEIDSTINEIEIAEGNIREIEIGVRRGDLEINALEDKLVFEMETGYLYSEPGILQNKDGIEILTDQVGDIYRLQVILDYQDDAGSKYDLKWRGEDSRELLGSNSNSYNLLLSNEGLSNSTSSLIKINFDLIG